MMNIYDIQGNVILSVPILRESEHAEELMRTDEVRMFWNAADNATLPDGAYVIVNDEKFSLLEPYTPTQRSENAWRYEPVFVSRFYGLSKVPFYMYTYEGADVDGTILSREADWVLTDNPANFMSTLCRAIKNETGDKYTYAIGADLAASATVTFNSVDIISALNAIANAFKTEFWLEKFASADASGNIGKIHLSIANNGETPKVLTVGENVNVPSITEGREGFYNRFVILGSTRNITQNYQGAGVNSIANKRLTLDPTEYPNGYIDFTGARKPFTKILTFDEIYPSASDLVITNVRARVRYVLDDSGNRKKISTPDGEVDDLYTVWYFQLKRKVGNTYVDFNFDDTTYDPDDNPDGMMLPGMKLSIHFNTGPLSGREFELTYHKTGGTQQDKADTLPFTWLAGDYEINYVTEGTYIIPAQTGLVPQDDNYVVLFNIRMPDDYTEDAQLRLKTAAFKEIGERYIKLNGETPVTDSAGNLVRVDMNSYQMSSNPVAFASSNPNLVIGSAVRYVNNDYTHETRVTALVTKLDFPIKQTITIGNERVVGTIRELQEQATNANQNIDLLAALNESTKQITDAYTRTQQMILSGMADDFFQENTTLSTLVELKSAYSYLGVKDGIFFSGATEADFEVQTINGQRVIHSRLPFYSDSFISAGGLSDGGGSAGGNATLVAQTYGGTLSATGINPINFYSKERVDQLIATAGTVQTVAGLSPVSGDIPVASLKSALGLGAAAAYGVGSVASGNTGLVTGGDVWTAIDNLPEPMVFKGSLGTGGTITSLPAASSANEGFTYKVITAGTYRGTAAKVGDTFISNGSSWILIPSGDEPEGTVTSVGLSMPTGFSVSSSPITSSGTLTVAFASGYSLPTTAKQSNWDTAYGWGNHANAGYLLAATASSTYATITALNGVSGRVTTLEGRTNWDTYFGVDENGDIYVKKNGNTARNFYSWGAVSAGGLSSGGGSEGASLAAVWASLKTNSDDYANEKINVAHIPDMASTYGYLKSAPVTSVAGNTGAVTAAQIATALGLGSNAYTSTAYLPLAGGTMSNTNVVSNLNADLLDGNNLITTVTDWNTSVSSIFKSAENTGTNAPTTGFVYGIHMRFHRNASNYFTDLVTDLYGGGLYFRIHTENGYGSWYTIVHSGNYTSYVNTTTFPGLNKTGTVTSVAMTVPTGLLVSGSPITTSGTLAISLASGYSIPTTAKQNAWDAKYSKPSTGIPQTDLASALSTKVDHGESAYNNLNDWFEIVDGNIHVKGNRGFYSDSFISAGGVSSGGGTSGVDLTAVWNNLIANTGEGLNKKIHTAHLPTVTITGTNISGTATYSGTGGSASTLTLNLTNSGVRSTTINGNYLRVNTNGTNVDLTIPYSSGAGCISTFQQIDTESSISTSGLHIYNGVGGDWTGSVTSMAYAAILALGTPSRGWQLWAMRGAGSLIWRNGNDNATAWNTERTILDSANYTSYVNTTNFPGLNKAGTVTSIAAGTGLAGGPITGSGTISINSTYQTYISNGNTAYGWGNHASAGYAKTAQANNFVFSTNEWTVIPSGYSGNLWLNYRTVGGNDGNLTNYDLGNGKGGYASVTASAFVKSGGTSAQFLKADGSVDSSAYLTGNQTITLSGDVSGSGTTSIAVAIGQGKVTNAMLAGSIANSKLANSAITINGSSTSLGSSFSTASITAGTAGQSTASSGVSFSVPYVTMNAYGIVTGYGTHTHTISAQNLYDTIGTTKYAAYNANGYLPLNGGTMSNTNVVTNLNANYLQGRTLTQIPYLYNYNGIGTSTSVTVNDLANYYASTGMIYADADNPTGSATWVHVWSQSWGALNTSWVSQIAVASTGMWYRANGANAITGKAWFKVYDSGNANLSTVPWACSTLTASGMATMSGGARIDGGLLLGGSSAGKAFIGDASSWLGSSYTGGLFYVYRNHPMYFYTNGSSRMFIAGGGNVGIGTTSPGYKLDVYGDVGFYANTSGDGAGIFIRNLSSNNSAGYILFHSANQNGFKIASVYTNWASRQDLVFYRSNNTTSPYTFTPVELMRLTYDGQVKVTGNILATGAITAGSASDARLKTNIQSLSAEAAKRIVMALNPVTFTWNEKATELYDQYKGNDLGFVAQEVENVLPVAIGTIFEKYKRLDQTKFIAPLVKVAQDHESRIRQLEAENRELRKRLKMN